MALVGRPKERVRGEVRRIMREGAPGSRFVFGTVAMPWALSEETHRAMLEAAREFGRAGAGPKGMSTRAWGQAPPRRRRRA